MHLTVTIPYALDRDLGRAYNEAMAALPADGWACLLDHDVQLLTPDAGRILHEYATRYPTAGLLTCYTNRIHPSSPQLLGGKLNENADLRHHIAVAEDRRRYLYQVTELRRNVSGFLMLLSRRSWEATRFKEGAGCLGVDTDYWRRLVAKGRPILRMEGLYVWHTYRLTAGINNKSHLYG